MLAANKIKNQVRKMPRACPVEFSCWLLTKSKTKVSRCHGLAPWSFMLVAKQNQKPKSPDATGLPRGDKYVECQVVVS